MLCIITLYKFGLELTSATYSTDACSPLSPRVYTNFNKDW